MTIMTILEMARFSSEMQNVIEFSILPLVQPEIHVHYWGVGDGFHSGDATTEQCIEEAEKVGIVPDPEINDEYDRNEDCVEKFMQHLNTQMNTAIEEYEWTSFLIEKDRLEVGDELVRLLYIKGEEIASVTFDENSAAIFKVGEKFIVHQKELVAQGMIDDDFYVFDTIYGAADKIICDIFEDEFREKIANFLDENVKGCDYKGDFRPYHAIYINCDTLDIFEMYEASNQYILQSNSVKIFDNRQEGDFSDTETWDEQRDEIVDYAMEQFHARSLEAAAHFEYENQYRTK